MDGGSDPSDDVYTLRLDELSSIVGVTREDLVAALKQDDAVEVAGAVLDLATVPPAHDHTFSGFVVGLDQLIIHTDDDGKKDTDETTALVRPHGYGTAKSRFKAAARAIGRFKVNAKHRLERRKHTCLGESLRQPHFTLSIPVTSSDVPALTSPRLPTPRPTPDNRAFLIPMRQSSVLHDAVHLQYLLAVSTSQRRPSSHERTIADRPREFKTDNSVDDNDNNPPTLFRRLSSLATLPSDVSKVTLETVHVQGSGDVAVQVVVTKRVPVVGYVLLVAALLTISSLGAALDLQEGVDPFVKLFWRTTASILGFSPFAARAIYEHGWPTWTPHLAMLFAASAAAYALFLMTFLWSLNHTSIGHAYIFNNCHSLLIVFGKLGLGHPVLLFEVLGSALGIVGGIVTTLDHAAGGGVTDVHIVPPSWQGDVVALVGAVGGVFYLLTAKKLRQEMDVFVFMTLLFVVTALLHLPVFVVLDIDINWSMDHHTGWLGWTQPDMLGIELYLVFVCTIIGTVGYISVMKYFDPIVVSVVMLLEPVLATAMGVLVGVDAVPGTLTWIGGFLVIVGTGLVVLASSNKTEAHDVSEVVHRAPPTAPVYSCKLKKKEYLVMV
ncbi:Aste57867_21108 [Aphanomyces stellatus]|uniref:Aste57867_21108 protein n=1 Tax=Aphanomyces stellatus TaxID=120398 RepID=A0A485LH96_9STRA|nr:hypothetical protein As57867_021040 [Aphanomyces stellatus]VFT97782.1 Aste57867_21108 [Aphanomyces stellatus]